MEKRVSLRDIAAAVGLHHTTVSMALRNSSSLPEETKRRIREAAEKLGYRPDPMLTALTAYRQSKRPAAFHAAIAWVNNWEDREALLVPSTYRDYYDGACDCAQKLGYIVEGFWMHEAGMTPAKLQRILKARNINGLLLAPQPASRVPLEIDFQEFSAVTFGYSLQPNILHLVTCHHVQVIDVIMAELVALGYRRPGFCVRQSSDSGGNYILISRLSYLYSRYPSLEQIPRAPSTEQEDLAKWIRKYKPDVLIEYNTLLSKIEALGYRVPQDIGFVSLDVDINDPHISGTHQNGFLIGKMAVDILVGMICRGERGTPASPVRTLIDGYWFPGETLRKQAAT